MGINKSNVRWVAHFQSPQLISEYLQEVGRGGRDGQLTKALILMSEPTGIFDPSDRNLHHFSTFQLQKHDRQAQQLTPKIPLQGRLETIVNQYPEADISLALLYAQGRLEWLDPFTYRLLSSSTLKKSPPLPDAMMSYLTTAKCRWQFLLSSFGFYTEADHFFCGHCDNCRRGRRSR